MTKYTVKEVDKKDIIGCKYSASNVRVAVDKADKMAETADKKVKHIQALHLVFGFVLLAMFIAIYEVHESAIVAYCGLVVALIYVLSTEFGQEKLERQIYADTAPIRLDRVYERAEDLIDKLSGINQLMSRLEEIAVMEDTDTYKVVVDSHLGNIVVLNKYDGTVEIFHVENEVLKDAYMEDESTLDFSYIEKEVDKLLDRIGVKYEEIAYKTADRVME